MTVIENSSSRLRRRSGGVVAAAVVATAVLGAVATPASGATGWAAVPGPAAPASNTLVSLASFGPNDAWSVGSVGVSGTAGEGSLTAHWDGRRWTRVPSPAPATLRGVAGVRSDDVWAVGSNADGSRSAVQRWNGRAWTEVAHVSGTAAQPVNLGGVTALTRSDVWAVGYRGSLGEATAHAQHWDGTAWRETALPLPEGALLSVLSAVAGTGPNNVWAAGFSFGEAGLVPYFVRWNGTSWSLVDVPATITGGYTDLTVLGPNTLVAVGSAGTPGGDTPAPVIATLTNGTWRQDVVPVTGGELNAISRDGTGGFWVAGDRVGATHDDRQPLVLRGRPGYWSVDATTPTSPAAGLRDVAAVPGRPGAAWAVGATGVTDTDQVNLVLGHRIG